MATTEKRLKRKCKGCGEWLENVHPYEGTMLCPECATRMHFKVKTKDSDEDKKIK